MSLAAASLPPHVAKLHHYTVDVRWTGNRGTGTSAYRDYDRDHDIGVEGKPAIAGSSDPAYRGDAARWNPDAPDYRKPAPHEFIPFSGGLHRCIGAVMATTEMTVMLARLVARTRLRLPAQRIRPANLAALAPRPGLTVDIIDSVPAQ